MKPLLLNAIVLAEAARGITNPTRGMVALVADRVYTVEPWAKPA